MYARTYEMRPNFFIIFTLVFQCSKLVSSLHPDTNLDIEQLISKHGYSSKKYETETEDGYILSLFRMKVQNGTKRKELPVLIMPGILSNAETWILSGPNISLPYLLVDNGYDTWLLSPRGSRYSRNHVKYDANANADYWNYSWDELGRYDIPAVIKLVLKETGKSKLFWIGHSMGTTSFFVAMAERPEYNTYIKKMIALSPVVYNNHMTAAFFPFISSYYRQIHDIMEMANLYELLPFRQTMWSLISLFCNRPEFYPICVDIFMSIVGYDYEQLDYKCLKHLWTRWPDDTSTRQALHYAQTTSTGEFKRYDFGPKTNKEKYGQPYPPFYNISKITAPVALFYSKNDRLLPVQDARRLAKELPNVVKDVLINYKYFNHMDFVHALNARKEIYLDVLKELEDAS